MNWGKMSRAERDAAYNNTDAVKNSAELNDARIKASAAFRQAHPEASRPALRAQGAQQLGSLPRRRSRTRPASSSSMAATGSATAATSSPA